MLSTNCLICLLFLSPCSCAAAAEWILAKSRPSRSIPRPIPSLAESELSPEWDRVGIFSTHKRENLVNLGVTSSVSSVFHQITTAAATPDYKKVCRGSSTGLAHVGEAHERYNQYKTMYTNCTYVDGNLELVFLGHSGPGQEPYNLDFLQDIKEITGYVLIVANFADYIPLTSLRIIRGRSLFKHNDRYYSLYVALNYKPHSTHIGLKELRFTSLHEILSGSVFFFNNNLLCYENTINWNDILTGEGATVQYHHNGKQHRRQCGECHESCSFNGQHHCWGDGRSMCQKLTRFSCSPQCDSRCFGPLPNQCCHSECAGGCSGPTKSECWACKNFYNEGMCENFCPPEFVYSPQDYRQVPNPRAKYAYGSLCVDKCPSHLIADKGACVQDCGAGRIAGKQGKCVDCDGPCPKTCHVKLEESDFINADNIHEFAGCTIIQGSIKILDSSFSGDKFYEIDPMSVSQLSVLESVQEVTDFVQIQANNLEFKDLTFLRNLKIIHGRKLDRGHASLQIFKTSLEMLGFESLREIRNGAIYVSNNSKLCYANTVKWEEIRFRPEQKIIIEYNRLPMECAEDIEVCSHECTDDGCWGPTDFQCISCRNFRLAKSCLQSCHSQNGTFTSAPNECEKCHPECLNCYGPGDDNCNDCKNARDGPYCIRRCPASKYKDESGICQPCHENCDGCNGPKNTLGHSGCKSCSLVVFSDDDLDALRCLPPDSDCDEGYFKQFLPRHQDSTELFSGKQGCKLCHPECQTCNGFGLSFCTSCRHFRQEDKCVSECASDYFVVPGQTKCQHCDHQCLRCTGETSSDCIVCKLYKVYADFDNREEDKRFNCTDRCPDSSPHKITLEINGLSETICIGQDSLARSRISLITGAACGSMVFIALVIFGVAMLCQKRAKAEATKVKLTAQMTGIEEGEPLKPTDVKPDMTMLRLIKQSELRSGFMIGSGAFGMVYKGLWIPEGENLKIPVAIKILQKGVPGKTEELLEEARIMASVVHPCCVSILCVCLTAQMMLITQLMPLGCLLDYLRKNQERIGSSMILNWCTQIAKGMAYLESRGIVHCDLAARNVLVQSPRTVKITDFGLAKMLDYGHDIYMAEGRKMPIKWLPLESIVHRIFTHKSDVWSYGVTIWEIFTFGRRPYEKTHYKDMPTLLERGERLPQPHISSIDVYMLMIKCWMQDVNDRPSFKELVEDFTTMSRDPERYLSIAADKLSHLRNNSQDQDVDDSCDIISDHSKYFQQCINNSFGQDLKVMMMNSSGSDSMLRDNVDVNDTYNLQFKTNDDQNRYSGLEQAVSNQRNRQNIGVTKNADNDRSRYCSDPCRLLLSDENITEEENNFQQMSNLHQSSGEEDTTLLSSCDYVEPNVFDLPLTYFELTQGSSNCDAGREREEEEYYKSIGEKSMSKPRTFQPESKMNPEYFDEQMFLKGTNVPYVMPYQKELKKAQKSATNARLTHLDRVICSPNESEHNYYNQFNILHFPPYHNEIIESPI